MELFYWIDREKEKENLQVLVEELASETIEDVIELDDEYMIQQLHDNYILDAESITIKQEKITIDSFRDLINIEVLNQKEEIKASLEIEDGMFDALN